MKVTKILFRFPFTWYFLVVAERLDKKLLAFATKQFNDVTGRYYYKIIL